MICSLKYTANFERQTIEEKKKAFCFYKGVVTTMLTSLILTPLFIKPRNITETCRIYDICQDLCLVTWEMVIGHGFQPFL